MSHHGVHDPATFVEELFGAIDREIRGGVSAVQSFIQAQAHSMAVGLLQSMLPALVRANYAGVKVSQTAVVLPAQTGIGVALGAADVGNGVLAGVVADKVKQGIAGLTRRSDYARGVNSIRW